MKASSAALRKAAHKGHYITVKKLIDAGADVNASNETMETSLILGVYKNSSQTVTVLLAAGAPVQILMQNRTSAKRPSI